MPVDERSRHALFQQLEATLGQEAATTLMEHLPPVGWADVATRRDLDGLRLEMRVGAAELRTEMADLRTGLNGQIGGLRTDLATQIDGALVTQTRTMLLAMLGVFVAQSGFILAVVRFA